MHTIYLSSFKYFFVFYLLLSIAAHSSIEEASFNERPWQVALLDKNKEENTQAQVCGGTLIDEYWVLTSANCLISYKPEDIYILSGTDSLEAGGKLTDVDYFVIHNDFNMDLVDNDIGLIKLVNPIKIKSLDIATPDFEKKYLNKRNLPKVVGWGNKTIEESYFPSRLYEDETSIVNQELCSSRYKEIGLTLTGNMLCAGEKISCEDSSHWDSGSPLIAEDKHGNNVQLGIISWGIGCSEPRNYGVYTRISNYHDWIYTHLKTVSRNEQLAYNQ